MKRKFLFKATFAVIACLMGWLVFRDTPHESTVPPSMPSAFWPTPIRSRLYTRARLRWLEKLGQVPEDADISDWQLAHETSWWGKHLDPKTFWQGRIVWLDDATRLAARSHGRMYPPLPYEDPRFLHYSNKDKDASRFAGIEGPNLQFRHSDREHAFWNEFYRNHPRPPQDLEKHQFEAAETILKRRYNFEHGRNSVRTNPSRIAARDDSIRRKVLEAGYPKEAFSEEAVSSAYMVHMKQEYQKLINAGHTRDSIIGQNFFVRLAVDAQSVTEPLKDEEVAAATAWKFAYLQRLQQEKVDESYIHAYLKAWKLSPATVFPEATLHIKPNSLAP